MKHFAKAQLSLLPVAENPFHNFAARHALAIYRSRAIYTFIPKNACSTMRYSLARNNLFISGSTPMDWHHSNNLTFVASQEFAASAEYAFVLLRCPFRRIASAYLDKVVTANRVVRSIYPSKFRKMQLRLMERSMYHSLSFRDFIERISRIDRLKLNPHWRPQVDFLLYDDYDDYYSVEEFSQFETEIIQKIGFSVYDARDAIGHDTSNFQKIAGNFADTPAGEVFRLREAGKLPSYSSLFDDALVARVAEIYADDLAFYSGHIGTAGLLFPDALPSGRS